MRAKGLDHCCRPPYVDGTQGYSIKKKHKTRTLDTRRPPWRSIDAYGALRPRLQFDLCKGEDKLTLMGAIRSLRPVNLICGLISNDPDLMKRAVQLLSGWTGPTDAVSEAWPFYSTDYYELEMGENLLKQFFSFERLIDPAQLAHMKVLTNDLEKRIIRDCALPETHRPVNLDPGYLTLSKLVLATTKDYSHRLYLREGIYAESTLHFEGGKWIPWPWTYPDYAETRYHGFFEQVRELYKKKISAADCQVDTLKG